MIEEILNTEVKTKIMKLLSEFPEKEFQATEISHMTNLSVSRISECLKELADKGVLESRKIGKGYLFKLSKSNYLARIILEAFKKEKELIEIIAKDFVSKIKKIGKGKVKSIVLYGSALRELKIGSDIDFLIVSEDKIERADISRITAELTEEYGFSVSSVLMSINELKRKMEVGEEFVINVIAGGKVVFGKNLEALIWREK